MTRRVSKGVQGPRDRGFQKRADIAVRDGLFKVH